ncbi:hypothetical protein BDY19DRAFT_22902 [Irpex rosettiformis]|uniref:Uncharacterized protein n=1 Tax=Irpex rosettiformis TaxID=378272 RepID=A0ACB8UJK7_9APHY|nr:hypothetical protein BDY19DRAFT_22902 [Irpex rosettiformis]
MRLSRLGVPSFYPVASKHADLPDATSQLIQPTYTPQPSEALSLHYPHRRLPDPHSATPLAKMNYPTTGGQYQATGEYATSCDFLYPFVDMQYVAANAKQTWPLSYPDTTYTTVAPVEARRPSTGSSSMSTPQLTASSGREASCSPISTYDETPSPRVDSIDYATVADGMQVYTAPAGTFGYEYADAYGILYADPALNGAAPIEYPTNTEYIPEYCSFQGAALQGCSLDLTGASAPTWPHELIGTEIQTCEQPLTEKELLSDWTVGQSHLYAQSLGQIAEPPSFASNVSTSQTLPAAATGELHHPRPQRGWLTSWQTAADFNAEEFLASLSRTTASQTTPCDTSALEDCNVMDQGDEDQFFNLDFGISDEMEGDWQIEGNASPGSIEEADPEFDSSSWTSAATAGVDIGQGIGLGFCNKMLSSDSILYQPVQFVNGSDTSWNSDSAGQYQLTALSPSFT